MWLASGWYPLHLCLQGRFYRRPLRDLQTRSFCYIVTTIQESWKPNFRVCYVTIYVETEPVLQDISGDLLSRGSSKHKRQDGVSMHLGSGNTNDRHSLMSGSVTQMPNLIRTSNHNRSIICMRTRKIVCIQEEFSTLSIVRLCPWLLQQLAVWEENTSGITVNWRSWLPSRKANNMLKLCHGSEAKLHMYC